jgi:cbb3-type cytochrome oxidase maturation protein
MIIVFILIPLGLSLTALALWAFFWATDHDQFDDLERHGGDIFEPETLEGKRPHPLTDEHTP